MAGAKMTANAIHRKSHTAASGRRKRISQNGLFARVPGHRRQCPLKHPEKDEQAEVTAQVPQRKELMVKSENTHHVKALAPEFAWRASR